MLDALQKLYFVRIYLYLLNPCGESDQLIVNLLLLKMAERSEAKSAKRSFASKIKIRDIFDAKLRFALLDSLRSVIFSEIQVNN